MNVNIRKMHILLVDDDLITRIGLRTLLEKEGYCVDDAENGQIAINKFNQVKYDVILMDYHIPDMDGATITKELRRLDSTNNKNTIIIGVTAHVDPKIKALCMQSGMDTVISKPVDLNKLLNLIQTYSETVTTA